MTDRQDSFQQELSRQLRDSADTLDAATQSRLNISRHHAVAQMNRRTHWASRTGWVAAGAVAVAVLAVSLWRNQPVPVQIDAQTDALPAATVALQAPDLELLLADESLEMLEDLEFYAWLDTETTDAETNG